MSATTEENFSAEDQFENGSALPTAGETDSEYAEPKFDSLVVSRPMPKGEVLLEAKGLVKAYHGRRVVNDVSFTVHYGEIVGLLGPNGAGKTTSFYMVTGLIKPNDGYVSFKGVDVSDLPMYQRARMGMGYLAQEPTIFRKLSVEDNILAILQTLDISAKERKARLEDFLAKRVFAGVKGVTLKPTRAGVKGYARYLEKFGAALVADAIAAKVHVK